MKEEITGVAVYSYDPKLVGTVVVGLWMRHDMLYKDFVEIMGLNDHVRGKIVVTYNRSGAIGIWWFVSIESLRQVQIAGKTLARIVSAITGARFIQRPLRGQKDVLAVLAA
ncbi:hypothetical protein HY415_01525 [Candidatus Kaiserbacteria bacterium]|nr:hypothetical protein [Candidatus Kaiserbacteria bacterium]